MIGLDGLLGHDSSVDIGALHVDGGGVSEIIFAVMRLLGIAFEPRIPRLSDRRLYAFPRARYGRLAPLFGRRLHRQGRMSDRTFENQAFKASGLNLATAAIVYWNTVYMSRAVDHLRATGMVVPDDLLAHVSPLGWRHISLTGDYLWQEVTRRHGGDGFMPLNIPAGRLQGAA